MAPKRKTTAAATKKPPVAMSPRRTRSITAAERAAAAAGAQAQAEAVEVDPPAPPPPPPRAAKKKNNAPKKAKKEDAEDLVDVDQAPRSRKGKEKVTEEEEEEEEEEDEDTEAGPADGAIEKKVIVEACKQCNSFKTRAMQVKKALEAAGITVSYNPEKPRRGCFEIREEDGQVFISLLNMARPFKPMKELNMDEVIDDILKKVT